MEIAQYTHMYGEMVGRDPDEEPQSKNVMLKNV
jgi:hypothetical protein